MLKSLLFAAVTLSVAHATELPAPSKGTFQQDVAWSPDGTWLAFSEFSGGEYSPDKWSVWVVRSDGTGRRKIADHALYVSWSHDGRKLAYGAERDGWGLFATSLDSGITECFTSLEHKDKQPAWSPDGRSIAFVSDRAGGSHLFVLDLATGEERQLTFDSLKDYNPQWSPSGDRLVFFREKSGGHDDIYTVARDGSGLSAVTSDTALDVFPCYDPRGGMVWSRRETPEGEGLLVRRDPDGTLQRVSKVPAFFARVSPDGARIAFVSGRWPTSAVYILELVTSEITKIIN